MAKPNYLEKLKVIKGNIEYEIDPAEEGGYVASVPLYSSCVCQGKTLEEALENIQDALLGCLTIARDLNLPIPQELEPLLKQEVSP